MAETPAPPPQEPTKPNPDEPQPAPVAFNKSLVDLERYERACAAAGFSHGVRLAKERATRQELLTFLQENEIPVYKKTEVDRYLAKLAGRYGTVSWRYLDSTLAHEVGGSTYFDRVPVEALELFGKVKAAFPQAAAVVSEITEVKDPFLAIAGFGSLIVIAKWDEPTFSLVPKKA